LVATQVNAFFLKLAYQPADLMAVQQKLAYPQRVGILPIAVLAGADVHAVDKYLAFADAAVGSLDVNLGAVRNDLTSGLTWANPASQTTSMK
jgi:hypothetical protein